MVIEYCPVINSADVRAAGFLQALLRQELTVLNQILEYANMSSVFFFVLSFVFQITLRI